MAEWRCRGLQILVQRFDSASGLQGMARRRRSLPRCTARIAGRRKLLFLLALQHLHDLIELLERFLILRADRALVLAPRIGALQRTEHRPGDRDGRAAMVLLA